MVNTLFLTFFNKIIIKKNKISKKKYKIKIIYKFEQI